MPISVISADYAREKSKKNFRNLILEVESAIKESAMSGRIFCNFPETLPKEVIQIFSDAGFYVKVEAEHTKFLWA